MKNNYNGMTLYIVDDYEQLSIKAARMVAASMILKPTCILGLATGSTPEGMYSQLVKMYDEGMIDFSEVTSFNLDEYYQLEQANEQSYAYYMDYHLFSKVNMGRERINIPNGLTDDVEGLCKAYDDKILDMSNMDIQVLGIGTNGHIGFNEPDIKFEAGSHLVNLDEETIEANARFFETRDQVPRQAISMGIRNIMHSKKIILLANGAAKAKAIEKMILGPVTPNLPASILQLHNDVTIILDKEAAVGIAHLIAK